MTAGTTDAAPFSVGCQPKSQNSRRADASELLWISLSWSFCAKIRGVCPGSEAQSDGLTGLTGFDRTGRKSPEKDLGITGIIMEINDLRKKGRK